MVTLNRSNREYYLCTCNICACWPFCKNKMYERLTIAYFSGYKTWQNNSDQNCFFMGGCQHKYYAVVRLTVSFGCLTQIFVINLYL